MNKIQIQIRCIYLIPYTDAYPGLKIEYAIIQIIKADSEIMYKDSVKKNVSKFKGYVILILIGKDMYVCIFI